MPPQKSKLIVNVLCTISRTYEKSSHIQWTAANKNIVNNNKFFHSAPLLFYAPNLNAQQLNTSQGIQENISALQIKKRSLRKRKIFLDDDETPPPGVNLFFSFILLFT